MKIFILLFLTISKSKIINLTSDNNYYLNENVCQYLIIKLKSTVYSKIGKKSTILNSCLNTETCIIRKFDVTFTLKKDCYSVKDFENYIINLPIFGLE